VNSQYNYMDISGVESSGLERCTHLVGKKKEYFNSKN
jgi:hypothetical protein